MNSDRKTAMALGVLFIIATVAAVSQFPFLGSLTAPDYLTAISASEDQVIIAAFLDLIMIAAIFSIPVVLFPILKRHNENLARGYVVARVFEAVPLAMGTISLLLLVTLGRELAMAGTADVSRFQPLGALLVAAHDWTGTVGGQIVFSMTALVLNYALYQSRLIPRFLSVWGLIGVPLMLTGGVLLVFDVVVNRSAIQTALMLPLAVQEMVFAVWLIVKGFNPSAIAPE